MSRSNPLSYSDAIARLFSLERWGIKLGLDNIRQLAAHLGDPQDRIPAVHIAGTNGKGSVTAIVDAILRASGYRVGRYTSPHLRDFRERIHVNGRPAPREFVRRFVADHWNAIQRHRYSYFEAVTAMAFAAFARARCDLAVYEVGLGGRFDATNILHPAVTVITHIDFDHERTLGNTLRQIAREKAGIIKPGTPLLVGPLPPHAREAIDRVAARTGAPLLTVDDVLAAHRRTDGRSLTSAQWTLPLPGEHQRQNLRVALACALLLDAGGIPVSRAGLINGARRVRWPARFQIDPGRPSVIYDVAHNPSGMKEFVRTWRSVYGNRRATVLFTTREDKRYRDMWRDLASVTHHWIGCPLPHSSGINKQDMVRLAARAAMPFAWADSAREGLHMAKRHEGTDGLVAVVGSHYLVGDVIPARLCAGNTQPSGCQTIQGADLMRAHRRR